MIETVSVRRARKIRSEVLWSAAAVLMYLAIEAGVFRSGWYLQFIEPNSTTGSVELRLLWFRRSQPSKQPEVAVFGDSRVAEGFSGKVASQASGNRLKFWNFGMAGSTPRIWYYLLRDMDKGRNRFQALVFTLSRYSDTDAFERYKERPVDLNYVIGRLRVTDCRDFADSMRIESTKPAIFWGCEFKGSIFRSDLRALFANRDERLRVAALWREHGPEFVDGYPGIDHSLKGLRMDPATHRIVLPPDEKRVTENDIRVNVLPQFDADVGESTEYRRLWFGRILELYRGSKTRIVFLQLPRGPLPPAPDSVPARYLASTTSDRRVDRLPEKLFTDLETPELFADGHHLNREGRQIFSKRLGEALASEPGTR